MREERQTYRVDLPGADALEAQLELTGSRLRSHCRVTSLSLGGAGVEVANGLREFLAGQRVVLHVAFPTARGVQLVHALVRHARAGRDTLTLGLQFVATADPLADGRRDELVRECVMELQRMSLARRSGLAPRRTR